ncbi:MAG TPA: lysine-sensitive aspartokinase 3 [Planctomycetota bacterium]|nr:lysine-sensitive aspartokinase 3 [Planctomycetota bacterium]
MPRVMKFGGSSLANAERLRDVARLVTAAAPHAPLVVLSAMGKTTDALFRAAKAAQAGDQDLALRESSGIFEAHRAVAKDLFGEDLPVDLSEALSARREELEQILRGVSLLRELSPRSMDAIASLGERLSTQMLCALLVREEHPARLFDARKVLCTDARFGRALPRNDQVKSRAREHLALLLGPGRAVVTQGYIGATEDGITTTLGRGGSDYSAAILGAALQADEVQIWTDVEGVLTADPRLVPEALPIEELSFAEAAELSAFGAKVLHPATIQPAIEAGIPVTVRHTQRPQGRFTTIRGDVQSKRPVTALATRGPITVLTVTSTRMLDQSGFLAGLFEVFGRLGVSVDMVATAEVSVSMTVERDAPLEELRTAIGRFAKLEVAEDRAIVAVVGERLKQTQGLAARIFGALADINVEMISMGANEINMSLVVQQSQSTEAVRRLHRALFAS